MIYNVTNNFIAINETAGTIQNSSYIYPVEISDKAEADSGILLFPLNKFTFSGTKLYMRCVDGGAFAQCRVVPFTLDFGGSTSTPATADDTQLATDTDADNVIDDSWDGDYTPNPDVDPVIDDMWNSDGGDDTGDGFSDDMDDIFNP